MIGNKKPHDKPLGTRNGLRIFKKLQGKTSLKTKKHINQTSVERDEQIKKERELKQKLLKRCGGRCENCGNLPDFRGLSKHEKKFRSKGGDPLDENNTILVCGKCHAKFHRIKED